ncbi:MAG: hypothetical protein ACRC0R_05245 [Cetobacterium sp.]
MSDVVIGKYLNDNHYRKRIRVPIIHYLYNNKINPKEYLITLSNEGIRTLAFYFNLFIMEKLNKTELIEVVLPVIKRKLRLFHTRLLRFKKMGMGNEDLILNVYTKM